MNRYEQAVAYHHKGFNCCQSVLVPFAGEMGLTREQAAALGMLTPVDPQDPVGSKRRTGALAKEFQKRFQEKFGDLRCKPLLKAGIQATDATPVARDMALTNRCDVLIITAMEIVEEMRGENA